MRKPNNMTASSSKIKFVESEEEEDHEITSASSSEEEEEEEVERELANITFEDLQKARSDGSHFVYRKNSQEKKVGRANKNRPMEVSAKKPVSRFREVVQAPKRVVRDPRFESLCGNLDVEGFRKRYDFLFENNLPAEKEELKKQLKKTHDPNVIDELKKRISWIDKQLKFESTKSTDAAILAEHKKKEREAAKHGKRPFYLKNSEIRKQRLVEKYNKLKAAGKLESFLEKRRRKNAAKDHKYMPYRRPSNKQQN
ncbi:Ribosomal RNA processing protein 36-like [Melia azedarach]|uniref:Ribosomal RNA processing protein 36-like n=1 Tax=Melia azedarach TaxID=155640 RepID=A0ACC1WS26_MELAZ|nr:Ribosomal RNA processing protein 36-like [Melia azedarach]